VLGMEGGFSNAQKTIFIIEKTMKIELSPIP
jgi:hypothetical protein